MEYEYKSKILKRLGVRTWINAQEAATTIGGCYLPSPVIEAMRDVAHAFCDMHELMDKASARVAQLCGADAAYITCGAAAGIVLSVAACITGKDTRKMSRLFGELEGGEKLKREFVMQAVQASHYDYQYFQGGGRLIRVGYPFGVETHMIEDAIGEKTAGLVYVHSFHNSPRQLSFEVMLEIAKKHDLPIIVDAAAHLPPKSTLNYFTNLGADLTIFSGGKAILGPNSTGFVLGRGERGKELIEAIRMQAFPSIWGIGRPFKVSKENVAGLVTALELFVSRDEEGVYAAQMEKANHIRRQLTSIPKLDVAIIPNDERNFEHPITPRIPRVYLEWDEEVFGFDAKGLDRRMAAEDPPVSLRPPRLTQDNTINSRSIRLVDTLMLRDGEEVIVAGRLKKAFLGE